MANNMEKAIIFARGGSKGIKNKNITILAGKPLIAHTIECGYNSRYISDIFVSTDCLEIAKISEDFEPDATLPNTKAIYA